MDASGDYLYDEADEMFVEAETQAAELEVILDRVVPAMRERPQSPALDGLIHASQAQLEVLKRTKAEAVD